MNCLICRQAEIIHGFTSITFECDEFKLLINNVPAQICPNCGEAIVDEDAAIRLLAQAEEAAEQGIPEAVLEYR